MSIERQIPSTEGRRIVICDYNALLLSVTGLLRMSGYAVFQAHDGWAAQELCIVLPNIELLILNTYGTGIDVGELCRNVRSRRRGMPILHIGSNSPDGLPGDVPTLAENFTAESLLKAVQTLLESDSLTVGADTAPLEGWVVTHRNGRRREDRGSRIDPPWGEHLPGESQLPLETIVPSKE
jgi:CheY-like chemotaxis protein